MQEDLFINNEKSVLNHLECSSRKRGKFNDICFDHWKEYEDVYTDSLWLEKRRDGSGMHKADYHGNFIPQIAYQLLARFTKKFEVVLDGFLGSGTTLIECRKLGRHGIGVELSESILKMAEERIELEPNPFKITTSLILGDSREEAVKELVSKEIGKNKRDGLGLLVLHPPYHDIIQFSENPQDLSNCQSISEFVDSFTQVVNNFSPLLSNDRFLGVVIGDKYESSEVIPLSFLVLNSIMGLGDFVIKGIIVKDIQNNRAKRNLENLWRYRALKGNFYIFKHEYILIFQKKKTKTWVI